ncbi:glycine dehydrogenase [Klebsiella michiganensis]|uniref:Glycine dehydrogenase n=1 Tax=Klebsiella michiganensis TaxID=1134687 RepID=A0A7H4PI22_9ENTR|nr:glycine dehydrogenase [Klebsiella michiganensis]
MACRKKALSSAMRTTSIPCAWTSPIKPLWLARAEALQINLRSDIHHAVGITLDEATTREDVLNLFRAIVGDDHGLDIDTLDKDVALDSRSIPASMLRDDAILTHPVFNRYHSETEMMRYMHALERKDLGAEPGDDPAGFLHHEAECRRRDDPDHLAGIRRTASVLPG